MKGVRRKSVAKSLSFTQDKKSEPFTPAVRKVAAGPRTTIQPGISQSVGHARQRLVRLRPCALKRLNQEKYLYVISSLELRAQAVFFNGFPGGSGIFFQGVPGGSGGFRGVPRAETRILEACRT